MLFTVRLDEYMNPINKDSFLVRFHYDCGNSLNEKASNVCTYSLQEKVDSDALFVLLVSSI